MENASGDKVVIFRLDESGRIRVDTEGMSMDEIHELGRDVYAYFGEDFTVGFTPMAGPFYHDLALGLQQYGSQVADVGTFVLLLLDRFRKGKASGADAPYRMVVDANGLDWSGEQPPSPELVERLAEVVRAAGQQAGSIPYDQWNPRPETLPKMIPGVQPRHWSLRRSDEHGAEITPPATRPDDWLPPGQ